MDLRRINLDALKPWIADKIARLVADDVNFFNYLSVLIILIKDSCQVPPDVAIDYCYKQLSLKSILVNGKEMQVSFYRNLKEQKILC